MSYLDKEAVSDSWLCSPTGQGPALLPGLEMALLGRSLVLLMWAGLLPWHHAGLAHPEACSHGSLNFPLLRIRLEIKTGTRWQQTSSGKSKIIQILNLLNSNVLLHVGHSVLRKLFCAQIHLKHCLKFPPDHVYTVHVEREWIWHVGPEPLPQDISLPIWKYFKIQTNKKPSVCGSKHFIQGYSTYTTWIQNIP